MMRIHLSAEMEAFIEGRGSGGLYGNATEVIRDALRRMLTDDVQEQVWHAAIKKGNGKLDRGERIPYAAKVLNDMHSRKPLAHDVLP